MGMYADLFKEESGVFRRSYNGNQVIVLKGERTGRNINISAPLYAADQDVAAVFSITSITDIPWSRNSGSSLNFSSSTGLWKMYPV